MNTPRQKRQSCEACRARKLRCSGEHSGCSRCMHMGLACKFKDKGMPGRPRKWMQIEHQEQHSRPSRHSNSYQPELGLHHFDQTPPLVLTGESSLTPHSPTDLSLSVPTELTTSSEGGDGIFNYAEDSSFPLLDFNTRGQLASLPLDSFAACLARDAANTNPTDLSPSAFVSPATPQELSCDCAEQVFELIRSLNREPPGHSTVHNLRLGIDLFDSLLTCHICFDVFKPPRITLQNVLLIGRLSLEVAAGYQKYLKWLKNYCSGLSDGHKSETVFLMPGADASSVLGFQIDSDKFYDLIKHGLQNDAKRLFDLGERFAVRQHNRHLVGHEACPDSEGRCWREGNDVDPDPSDVCPKSEEAKILIPCYRVVDEVRLKIKQLGDAVT